MKKPKILAIVIIVFSTMLSSFAFYFYQVVNSPNLLVQGQGRPVTIPSGATFKEVQNILYDQRFTNDLVAFSFLAKLMSYDENVKSGLYYIEPNMSNREAIRLLRSGDQTPVNITFNNARILEDLAPKITKNLEIDTSQFLAGVRSDSLQKALGFDGLSIIGMFIPNTYQAYWNTSAQALLKKMKGEYDKFWTEERKSKANSIGLSPKEVSTLASIVQAETANSAELARVAGLYVNRLNTGMKLDADPTLKFAAQDFTIKRVLNIHKEIDSPYNTYMYSGLPPGPINMPEMKAIDAVLNYENHKYLYMCAKEDFSENHSFATNLIDHNRNAAKYQRALNKARIYR
ncbi:MAG: endolytic transglycosylase MltG [Cyclobacteriaceae bacterium]